MKTKYLKTLLLFTALTCLSFSDLPNSKNQYKLIVFEGSDWCRTCMKLEQNVFSEASFEEFTNDHQIEIERIDFPQRKRLDENVIQYNAMIAKKYNFQGVFPTLVWLDLETGDSEKIYYTNQSYSEFIALLTSKIKVGP